MTTVTLKTSEWSCVLVALDYASYEVITDQTAKATVVQDAAAIRRIIQHHQPGEEVPIRMEPTSLALIHWVLQHRMQTYPQHPQLGRIVAAMQTQIDRAASGQ